ncbi:hypothetical protein QFC20_003829 [Naganishia adeliensis]|uniref:Uncharacterized protein n=1 Tax=Naganishia adeliensis TaxID=92952 RepID=A0ACC2W7D6_9TREE|nr:hypothetical protein QFC20_003829 [Naganishia adeliensis]
MSVGPSVRSEASTTGLEAALNIDTLFPSISHGSLNPGLGRGPVQMRAGQIPRGCPVVSTMMDVKRQKGDAPETQASEFPSAVSSSAVHSAPGPPHLPTGLQ